MMSAVLPLASASASFGLASPVTIFEPRTFITSRISLYSLKMGRFLAILKVSAIACACGYRLRNSWLLRTARRGLLPAPVLTYVIIFSGVVNHLTYSQAASLDLESFEMLQLQTPRIECFLSQPMTGPKATLSCTTE